MSTRLVKVQCRQQDDCIVITVNVSSSGLSKTVAQNQVLLCASLRILHLPSSADVHVAFHDSRGGQLLGSYLPSARERLYC